ncbi:ZINC KNUCKLE (CCHC-TYPE) FAMILY PROTEIN [Salix viminalis]|uniref:ZINC KNUCKLE (CCHC-TYPE) FAMILY PROTEIN n=1 Tax=Salix viminalis TaxID=40686 RepID=A0A9Q0SC68_SALVM|nr:ZINC KNUCKLE (CCHC-TYPE) FAMILY PROTEIN [Salix viminalis]
MAKKEKRRAKTKVIEEEDDEEKQSKEFVAEASSDDEEANEDLSLKIVEKSLMRAAKLAENGNGFVVLDDGCGGGIRDGGAVEIALTSSMEAEEVSAGSRGVKKRKKRKKVEKKMEVSAVIAKEEEKFDKFEEAETVENAEIMEKAEKSEKVEVDEAVELVEDDGANAVEDSVNTVLRKLLRGPRYFDPLESGWSNCYNCGEEGHMTVNCPTFTKKIKPCFVCGSLEHGAKQCTKGQDCFICKESGHRAKDCPQKYKGTPQSSKICLKCGGSGHEMFSCMNDYSVDDLKEIQCYICKSFGHLCCFTLGNDGPRQVSCYRCGELGHTGLECRRLHEEASMTESPSSCYRCGEGGHFARECTSSAKGGKRNHALSIPTLKAHRENKESLEMKSAPHDLGKARKKRKTKSKEQDITTPQKSKHKGRHIAEHLTNSSQSTPKKSRGGWIMDDPGDVSKSTPKQSKHRNGWITEDPGDVSWSNSKNHFKSPSTPSYKGHKSSPMTSDHHMSNSQTFKKNNWSHSGTSAFQGSATPNQHRYSASRFGNPGNAYENSGHAHSNSGHTYSHSGHAYNSSGHAHNNSRYARDNSWYAQSNSGYVYNN